MIEIRRGVFSLNYFKGNYVTHNKVSQRFRMEDLGVLSQEFAAFVCLLTQVSTTVHPLSHSSPVRTGRLKLKLVNRQRRVERICFRKPVVSA